MELLQTAFFDTFGKLTQVFEDYCVHFYRDSILEKNRLVWLWQFQRQPKYIDFRCAFFYLAIVQHYRSILLCNRQKIFLIKKQLLKCIADRNDFFT